MRSFLPVELAYDGAMRRNIPVNILFTSLIALLNLSSWCLVMVERLFLTVPRGCLQFVIVVFPDHTHLLLHKNNTQD